MIIILWYVLDFVHCASNIMLYVFNANYVQIRLAWSAQQAHYCVS